MANDKNNAGLGGIFSGLGSLLDLVNELQKQAQTGDVNNQKTFTTQSGLQGVVGVNIRTNLAGEPTVTTFGNVSSTQAGPSVDSVREPMVDVLEEDGGYTVIAELPGADEKSVKATLEDQALTISAAGAGKRSYEKTLSFDRPVKQTGLRKQYQNGILEVFVPYRKKA
jgi:HSP20 family molecular chaperone IbpA